MKIATVALVVRFEEDHPSLVTIISEDREIALLEAAHRNGERDPLKSVFEYREEQEREEDEFGDYVEDLLTQPFVRPEIQEHGVEWLKSKLRIEKYQRHESEAAKVIAEYALKLLKTDREKTDFILAGPSTMVRIRVFVDKTASNVDSAA